MNPKCYECYAAAVSSREAWACAIHADFHVFLMTSDFALLVAHIRLFSQVPMLLAWVPIPSCEEQDRAKCSAVRH